MNSHKNMAVLGVVGISILVLAGCSNAASTNRSSKTVATKGHSGNDNADPLQMNPTKDVVNQTGAGNSIITIYHNPDFLVQSKSKQYTSYFSGLIHVETTKQMSQEEKGGHSPWRASPIYVAVYGTQNFAPLDEIKQISDTPTLFTGKYNHAKVTYSLVSSTTNAAKVVEKGLPYSLAIDLYRPFNHHYWLIDKIQLNA